MKKLITKLLGIIVFVLIICHATSQNLIPNLGFRLLSPDIPNPKGYCWNAGGTGSGVNLAGIPYVGGEANVIQPKGWRVWLNGSTTEDKNNLCIISEVLPMGSNCIPYPPTNDGVTDNIKLDKIVHLKLTKSEGGMVTVLTLPKTSSKQVYSCWVYVIKGKAELITLHNPGAGTVVTATSTSTCKWEKLSLLRTDNQGNEITIYSANNDAEFYVASVSALF